MNNEINNKEAYEEMERIYKNFDYIFDNGDVGVYKNEEGFWSTVDFGVFKNIDALKKWCIESFEECKDSLEEKYRMADTTKYIYESSVGYEIDYISDAEVYGISFDIPNIKTIDGIYDWICKAIRTIHNIK